MTTAIKESRSMLHAVIMAGGSGTRFWPQSRMARPKQFLQFGQPQTLLQQAVTRCQSLIPPTQTWIVTNTAHVAESRNQAAEIPVAQILPEPIGRNTAPCVGLAALQLLHRDPDAIMLVMPADHIISPPGAFIAAVNQAVNLVEQEPDRLVLFGAKPTFPATGYGYIERGSPISGTVIPAFDVHAFREKPDQKTAESYLAAGKFDWNCGIFVWRAETIWKALETHAPDVARALSPLKTVIGTPNFEAKLAEIFPTVPSISIDYAVLEKARQVCVVAAPFEWDDVGSWPALARWVSPDEQGNTVDGLFCGVKTSGCVIRSTSEHLIGMVGVRDLVIVHTPEATLIADKNDENSIRLLVEALRSRGLERYL